MSNFGSERGKGYGWVTFCHPFPVNLSPLGRQFVTHSRQFVTPTVTRRGLFLGCRLRCTFRKFDELFKRYGYVVRSTAAALNRDVTFRRKPLLLPLDGTIRCS